MLRGLILGFGEVARNGHWPAYQSNCDVAIVGVVDRSSERRALAASLSPGLRTFASLADVPKALSIDFIDICTPPALHAEPMLSAIARDWHVVCEKPFLLDPIVVERARARAIDAGVALVPVHNWKFAPIVKGATAALRSGAIGKLTRVNVETSRLRAAPTADSSPNWRRDPAIAGGGILMDHGWHSVYLVLHWFAERARSVRATLQRPSSASAHPVEDEAHVIIEFPSGRAELTMTWNGGIRRNAMRLEGTHGEIVVDDDLLVIQGEVSRSERFPQALSAGSHHEDWFAAMLPDVVACFRQPTRSRPLVDEAAQCLSIIQEAYRSDAALASTER